MGRLNGTYPSYSRLKFDPEIWPDHYWDKCRECTNCEEICWPALDEFKTSPCCTAPTKVVEGISPNIRWPEALKQLLTFRFDTWYDKYNENVSDERLHWEDLKTAGKVDDGKVKKEITTFLKSAEE